MNDNAEELIDRITPENRHDELADNVEMFPGISPNKYEPDVILRDVLRAGLSEVVVIGWNADGELYFRASNPDGGECLWLMEKAKHALLTAGED